jgi:hypothetical protein
VQILVLRFIKGEVQSNATGNRALGYFANNVIKIRRTLRVTPAMAAGVTDRLWDVEDLVAAWEASERRPERQAA